MTQQKNVLFIVPERTPNDHSRWALEMASDLRSDGYACGVVARPSQAISKPFADRQLLYATMAMRGPAAAIVTPVALASLFNKLGSPLAVHTASPTDFMMAARSRRISRNEHNIRIFNTITSFDTENNLQTLFNIFSHNTTDSDGLIFTDEALREEFSKLLSNTAALNRIHVLKPALPTSNVPHEKPAATPHNIHFALSSDTCSLLNTLIDALATIKHLSWNLTVSGSGPSRTVMPIVRKARAEGIDNRIDWAGDACDFKAKLQATHIAVVDNSPLGLSAIEATAHGCIVVAPASAKGRSAYGNSFFYADADVSALATLLQSIIADSITPKPSITPDFSVAKSRFVDIIF